MHVNPPTQTHDMFLSYPQDKSPHATHGTSKNTEEYTYTVKILKEAAAQQ